MKYLVISTVAGADSPVKIAVDVQFVRIRVTGARSDDCLIVQPG